MTGSSGGRRERPGQRSSGSRLRIRSSKTREIEVRRLALRAAQASALSSFAFDAGDDLGEPVARRRSIAALRSAGSSSPWSRSARFRTARWLAILPTTAADDVLRRFGGAILRAAQQHVAADRPFDAGLKASGPVEQDDGDARSRASA